MEEMREWLESILMAFPGRTGKVLRKFYYGKFLGMGGGSFDRGCLVKGARQIKIGSGTFFLSGSLLYASSVGKIVIGSHCHFNHYCMIDAAEKGEIFFGDHCLVGPFVVARASNHKYLRRDLPIQSQGHEPGRIVVGSDVWIGAHVVLLPGCHIGEGAVIAAGAVVNGEIPPYALAGGVPAKVIREEARK